MHLIWPLDQISFQISVNIAQPDVYLRIKFMVILKNGFL